MFGMGFGDPGSDDADAHFADQLDADTGFGISVLEIVDELRKIFDRVNIMVGWRGDQSDAGGTVANAGNVLIDFGAGKLTPFAGFGTLRDLDLEFIGIGEIVDRHTKSPGGDLLDGGTFGIAVGEWLEADGIFATFTRIAFPFEAVHGHGDGFMGLGADRAEAHCTGAEASDDELGWLHFFDGDRLQGRLEAKQAAEGALHLGIAIDVLSETPVGLRIILTGGVLKIGDGLRVPAMLFAVGAPVEFAMVEEFGFGLSWLFGEAKGMSSEGFFGKDIETATLDAAAGSSEAAIDDFGVESKGFKDLCPFVALQSADPHLSHDLEDSFLDGRAIGLDQLLLSHDAIESTIAFHFPEGFEGEVGIDGIGTVADKEAMMVDFAGFAGFEDQSNLGPFGLANEMMVHGSTREKRADGDTVRADGSIAQNHQRKTIGDGGFGFEAKSLEGSFEAGFAESTFEGHIEDTGSPFSVAHDDQGREFIVGENRVGDPKAMSVFGGGFEDVLFGTDRAIESEDDLLANGVDGRVGDLGEELSEVVVDEPRFVAKACQGGIVPHAADGIAGFADHRHEHEVQGFRGVAEGLETRDEGLGMVAMKLIMVGEIGERDPLLLEPSSVGSLFGDLLFDLGISENSILAEVDEEDLAGLDATFAGNIFGRDVEHADFAREDDSLIARHVVAAGPKSVSIEHGSEIVAIREEDSGWSIPRFHEATVIFVERPDVGVHRLMFLPGLGDHHHHGFWDGASVHDEKFEDVVEGAAIAATGFDDREKILQSLLEQRTASHPFAGSHPVGVATESVDFPVMADHAERLSPIPGGESIGGETAMDHGQMGLVVIITEVWKKWEELIGSEHPLVDNGLAAEAAEVEVMAISLRWITEGSRAVFSESIELPFEEGRVQ